MDLSRRDFLKGTVAGAAGVALTGLLGGCATQEAKDTPAAGSPQPDPTVSPAVPAEGTRTVLLGDILNPQEDFTACTTDYSHIFSPLKIGGVTMRNRLGKSSAGSEMQKRSDWPDDTTLEYYRRFSEGGIGMICTEASNAIPSSIPPEMAATMEEIADMPWVGGADNIAGLLTFTADAGIPAHKLIADTIHAGGALAIGQVTDVLGNGSSSTFTETTRLENSFGGRMQSTEEIREEIRKFIDAAERYYKADFDGIELNASCNHYFSTYLSRRMNYERTDQYSGSMRAFCLLPALTVCPETWTVWSPSRFLTRIMCFIDAWPTKKAGSCRCRPNS